MESAVASCCYCWSVSKSCPTLCDPMDSSTTRLSCPSLSPRACSNSCPLTYWWHPTISYSVTLFSSCLQSFPISGSFPMNRLFTSGGQGIGASASVFSMNSQNWFTLGLTGLVSLLSKGLSVFSKTTVWKFQFFGTQPSMVQLSHPYMTTGKTTGWLYRPLSAKWCLCFLIHCIGLS